MEHPLNPDYLPENVRRATNPILPKNRKMAVAAGLMPMASEDNILALYQLSFDGEPEVAAKAADTLVSMPGNIMAAAVRKFQWAEPLDHIGKIFSSSVDIISALLTNRAAANETVADIAGKCTRDIVDIIAGNQARLMEHPPIIEAIYLNKNARMSTVDRIITFAVRNNIQLEGLSCYKEISALYQIEQKEAGAQEAAVSDSTDVALADSSFEMAFVTGYDLAAAGKELPGEEMMIPGSGGGDLFGEFDTKGAGAAGVFGEFDSFGGSASQDDGLFTEFDMSMDARRKKVEEEQAAEDENLPLEMQIGSMPISHKIRLATIGNAHHRSVLLLDSNKMVSMAAIKSPAITDQEVVRCSQSRAVATDVLRYIATSREWTKNYFVKVNLINNPKTPLDAAMRFLTHLQKQDLKGLSSNKNVPNALRTSAKNMLKKKTGGRGV
jgi:hypothetical protein